MRTPTLLVAGGLLALGACAHPASSVAAAETVDAVCADAADLALEIADSENMLAARWTLRVDDLGVRAASIGTRDGDRLMEGLAWLSVGISEVDVDLAVDGVDRIADVCL